MIKAFLGAIAVLLAAAATAAGPPFRTHPARARLSSAWVAAAPGRPAAEGTSSTPGMFTIRAGAITRRSFARKVVGRLGWRPLIEEEISRAPELALPFGHCRTVTFGVRQGTEAHEIDSTLTADFVAGTFAVRGVHERLGACYVRRWLVRMSVNPN